MHTMHTTLSTRSSLASLSAHSLVALALLACGCGAEVNLTGSDLPVAALVCPQSAQVGVPFDVDGSSSSVLGGELATQTLQLTPGFEPVTGLSSTFTATSAGVLTALLEISDQKGNTARAACRITVGGTGIGDGDGNGDGTGDGTGDDGDDGDVGADPPVGEPVDIGGTFALVAYDRPELENGMLDPARQCAPAPQLSLVTLSQSGADVTMSTRTCLLTLPNARILGLDVQRSTIPNLLIDALPVAPPVTFNLGSAVTGAAFAPSLAQLGAPMVVGATLDDPVNDDLPASTQDPRVNDGDGDGEPGVSILSGDQPQFLVYRRTIRAFAGVVRSNDVIEGTNEGSYRVDSEASLLTFFGVASFFLVPTGNGMPSTFHMSRVDGRDGATDLSGDDGVLTCDDLRDNLDALVAAFPPPPSPADCPSYN